MNTPRLDELIPQELLQNPVPMHSHWESFEKLIRIVIPATVVGIVFFAIALLSHTHQQPIELTLLFALGGAFMLFLNVYAVYVAEDERLDKEWRRNIYQQQLSITQIAIQHLTVIQRATHVNIGTQTQTQTNTPAHVSPPAARQPQLLYPEVDTEINSIYQVALVCIRLAYTAWRLNDNKRPKIKPFSFDAVVKEHETGHIRWKAALEWLEESNVIKNALQSNWAPLCSDELKAIDLLDRLVIARGYYRHQKGKETEWRHALPQV